MMLIFNNLFKKEIEKSLFNSLYDTNNMLISEKYIKIQKNYSTISLMNTDARILNEILAN